MASTSFHVCYHCKDRKVGCHGKCELYLKEKAENDEIRKKTYEENRNRKAINDLHVNRVEKLQHKKGIIR